jgi:hypothetical protein
MTGRTSTELPTTRGVTATDTNAEVIMMGATVIVVMPVMAMVKKVECQTPSGKVMGLMAPTTYGNVEIRLKDEEMTTRAEDQTVEMVGRET